MPVSPAVRNVAVELELPAGHVEESAEVDVVSIGGEGASHHLEVEAIVGTVHTCARTLKSASTRIRIPRIHVPIAFEAEIQRPRGGAPAFEELDHLAADRPRCADDCDHAGTLPSLAFSAWRALTASQSSIRCPGSSGWRPV